MSRQSKAAGGGPFDDEILGKAYDARLMAKLWAHAALYRRWVYGSIALFPATALVELAQPYLVKMAIDDHILRGDWTGLSGVAGLFLLSLGVLYALRAWQSYLMTSTGQQVMHDLRETLFRHVQRLDAAFFDKNPVGRLMTRILNDVEAVSDMFSSGLLAIIGDVVTLSGVVLVMLLMNWKLALVTFAVVPVLAVAATFFRSRARAAYREVRVRLARLNAFLQEAIQGVTVVQLFTKERQEAQSFQRLNADHRRALFRSTTYDASLYAVVEAIGSVAVALLLWWGGGQVWEGTLTFGALVAFIEYTNRFYLPIRDAGAKYTVMQSAMASAERIFGLLELRPAIRSPISPVGPRVLRGEIEFARVWFAYRGEEWVLRDCSFRMAPGERVAIVGATGEGKSTIVKLINRSYDVSRGRLSLDGVDVREWELTTLRRQVGVILQDVFLFSGTVEANLRLGNGHVSREVMERAAEMANARAFIAALPRGYQEEVRERGANFSQGQRQLLAIARALVYDPAVLILDEATSSVDPESEAMIQEALGRLLSGRTSLVVAHRLSTIKMADRILVLHKGQVREEGTHADLLRQGGLYARLYELQFGTAR